MLITFMVTLAALNCHRQLMSNGVSIKLKLPLILRENLFNRFIFHFLQCSGEAIYACDVSTAAREVHVAFVLSSVCVGEIDCFDASAALVS